MPKKKPPTAEDIWRDFFDDTDRTLSRLSGNLETYFRAWDYPEREWFVDRVRDLIATLNDVEATALRSMDDDEGTEGANCSAAVH
jgi:hypothetical protein